MPPVPGADAAAPRARRGDASGALPRLAAAQLLHLTLDRRRTLEDAMGASEAFAALSGADRGFARAIASTALRRLGHIDKTLRLLISRPLTATQPEIRALLRAGAAQLWYMSVPPHAAVGATVAAARLWQPARSGGGFVNAGLRRASERAPPDELPVEEIWPDWLRHAFAGALGHEAARQLAEGQLTEPPLYLTARSDPAAVAAATGGRLTASGSIEAPVGFGVEALPGYAAGEWWVQDAAAALAARLLDVKPGERALDLCAAPGGKTLQLAAAGAHVTALDRSRPRLERLAENLTRTRLSADIVAADAETWRPPAPYPKILLDAPCSALGTLARHPEGAWIKTVADAGRFPALQARLLAAAAQMLAPGGALVYTVCTPLPAEGADILPVAFGAGLQLSPILPHEVPGFAPCLRGDGTLLTLPVTGAAHDAFFAARFVRPAA